MGSVFQVEMTNWVERGCNTLKQLTILQMKVNWGSGSNSWGG